MYLSVFDLCAVAQHYWCCCLTLLELMLNTNPICSLIPYNWRTIYPIYLSQDSNNCYYTQSASTKLYLRKVEKKILFLKKVCCHFCHLLFPLNRLIIRRLCLQLKVTVTKTKNRLGGRANDVLMDIHKKLLSNQQQTCSNSKRKVFQEQQCAKIKNNTEVLHCDKVLRYLEEIFKK